MALDPDKLVEPEVIVHPEPLPPTNPAHNWKQRGFTIHCDTCRAPHGINLTPDEVFRGVNPDGSLRIEKIQARTAQNVVKARKV